MANSPNPTQPRGNDSDTNRDRSRSSNDSDQNVEREGVEDLRGNERADDASVEDIDPDSARSDVDRDDTIDEP